MPETTHAFAFTIDELERMNTAVWSARFEAGERYDAMSDFDIRAHGSREVAEAHWLKIMVDCDAIMEKINPFLDEVDFQERFLGDSLEDVNIEKFLKGDTK